MENFDWSKFTPCSKCQDGFIIDDVSKQAKKCTCRISYEKDLKTIISYYAANLITSSSSKDQYTRIKEYSLSNYKGPDTRKNLTKIKKFITNFTEKYSSLNLFFSGLPGTQKTTVAKYILSELLKENKTGYYIILNDLIDKIIDSERNPDVDKELKEIIEKDILIIDEFSEDSIVTYKNNTWQLKHLFPFLKKRFETVHKSTIIISNKTIDNLGEYFKGPVQDLIEREIPDKTMIFEDNYAVYKPQVNIDDIWR